MTRPLVVDPDYAALACGVDRDEGVIVAYIPKMDAVPVEHHYRDGGREFLLYSFKRKVIDMLPFDRKNVKWWQVREAARALKLDYIEPIFACAAEDFRVSSLPQLPKPEGTYLAFRQYSRGPWVNLEAKEEPKETE